ncbi:hypothetical protein Leryth_001721 [Lithospermum erythrorhizon]|nr:hypothetical protein Leryth_001721 [Lithospermum erythrorhizon]
MSFRGRGRGRGFGSFRSGKQESWCPFPEIEDLGTAAGVVEKLALAKWYSKLHSYWRASPYYYEGVDDASSKGARKDEIERFSDMITSKTNVKPPLSHFIKMEPEYVPAELARGERKRPAKQIKWKPDSDLSKFDLFAKLERKHQDRDTDEKKEGESEEEDEERENEEDEESSDDGDYNQNIDFDDDEDDYNMADDGDDEPIY